MAKNRVAPERPSKTRDPFFKKLKSKFHKPKFNCTSGKEEIEFRPSTSDSNNFFFKSYDAQTSKIPDTKSQNFTQKDKMKTDVKVDKKPFDKKKYRLQKYSKKYKLEQWEEKRKKTVLREYYKSLKEDEINPLSKAYKEHDNESDKDVNSEGIKDKESISNVNNKKILDVIDNPVAKNTTPDNSKVKKKKSFQRAHQEYQRLKEEKEKKKEDYLKKKMEKEEALQECKKKKAEKFKKLNKKTRKGQPIMKDRMEMLLEKIQNSIK